MFFTKLFPLLASLNLSFDLKPKGEKVRLIIKFKIEDEKSEQINLTPLVIEALPQDLDNELIDELINHLKVSVPSLSSQINILTLNLKKVLETKTKTASAKTTTKTKVETVKKESPVLDFDKPVEEPKKEEVPVPVKPKRKRRSKAQIEAEKQAKIEAEKQEEIIDKAELEKEDDSEDLFSEAEEDKPVDLFSDDLDDDENPFG